MEIKNLKKAADRILEAVKNEEKIILYGDADLDGVGSVIILKEAIKSLGGKVMAVYFPDREIEGYGISETALNYFKKLVPALLITLDCGIGNLREIKLARKMGFGVIVIDHHKVLDELPEADIIVDPKQKGDKYPFKELANVGIAFKLSEVLLKEKMGRNLRNNFLELVALGTIADMMPRVDDNRIFIKEGMESLVNSWRPGLKAFFESPFLADYNLNQKISKIISIANIRDVEDNLPASFRLLTTPSLEEAKDIISKLKEKSEVRKGKIREIIGEIEDFSRETPIGISA
jgi:single-stranded-DNA-specific exonuclease